MDNPSDVLSRMAMLRRILEAIGAFFHRERLRGDLANRCDHPPVGSCGKPECNAEVEAGHFN
jgi:hypothetical protein